ncbi:MAG: hypothetical protein QXI37_00260 [Thermoprotei archaeon]
MGKKGKKMVGDPVNHNIEDVEKKRVDEEATKSSRFRQIYELGEETVGTPVSPVKKARKTLEDES